MTEKIDVDYINTSTVIEDADFPLKDFNSSKTLSRQRVSIKKTTPTCLIKRIYTDLYTQFLSISPDKTALYSDFKILPPPLIKSLQDHVIFCSFII